MVGSSKLRCEQPKAGGFLVCKRREGRFSKGEQGKL
jgi:hypothetical protein